MRLSISGVIASSILTVISGGGGLEETTTTTTEAPPIMGTLVDTYCNGYDKIGVYADGSGGTYTSILAYDSPDCGYEETTTTTSTQPPSYGTIIDSYCNGYDKIGVYADGSGGTYENVMEYNSGDCGYSSESYPTYGTSLGTFCEGYDLMESFADGNGGAYSVLLETNASACGYA